MQRVKIGMRSGRSLQSYVVLFGLLAAAGCGSKGTISGKLSYRGQQLPTGSRIIFQVETGAVFSGNIRADGSYTVDKIPPGPVQIAIYVPKVTGVMQKMKGVVSKTKDLQLPGGVTPKKNFNLSADTKTTIPPKYGDPKTSGLTYTVKNGKQEHDIELK
jgi:hypothetical protein